MNNSLKRLLNEQFIWIIHLYYVWKPLVLLWKVSETNSFVLRFQKTAARTLLFLSEAVSGTRWATSRPGAPREKEPLTCIRFVWGKKRIEKLTSRISFFLMFPFWLPKLSIFESKIGSYVKIHPFSQFPRSRILRLGQIMRKVIL